jgi:uncharacterized Zn finger protein (UPF0148 family)
MERVAQEKAAELGIELMPLREAFNEMRRRMIEGWTMSQQACPISGFPLVKKKGVVWSIRCKCELTDPDEKTGLRAVKAAAQGAESAFGGPSPASKQPTPKKKLAGTPGRREKMNQQSKLISEKLLQGWKMLKAVCPITAECPLLEDKAGRQWSAAINMYVDEYQKESSMGPQAEAPPRETTPAPTSNNIAGDEPAPEVAADARFDDWKPPTAEEEREIREKQKRSDAMSKKMGQMLLVGWKMLEEICPVTREVPLMMDKEGKKFSVALNAYITEEGEMEGNSSSVSVAPPAPQNRRLNMEPSRSRPAAASTASAKRSPAGKAPPTSGNRFASNIDASIEAVRIQLSDVTDELSMCENTTESKILVDTIDSCAKALKSLAEAKRALRDS